MAVIILDCGADDDSKELASISFFFSSLVSFPVNNPNMSRGGRSSDFETSAAVKPVDSFDAMGLSEDLIRGIYAYGTCSVQVAFPPSFSTSLFSMRESALRPEPHAF